MQCPYCAEEIKNNAIVCKHCHRDLTFYTPISRRLDTLEGRLAKIEQALTSLHPLPDSGIEQSTESYPRRPASFYIATLLVVSGLSTALYAYYEGQPLTREWALWLSIVCPLFAGIWIGLLSAERTLSNMLVVGVANGLLVSIGVAAVIMARGHRIDMTAVLVLYFLPPSLFLFLGGFSGEWLAQKLGWRTQNPLYARTLARLVIGPRVDLQNNIEKEKQLEQLTKSIAAITPLLTFLASIIGAWLAYLGTIKK